ncbi:unnamed protein product [Ixodes persulcatus]
MLEFYEVRNRRQWVHRLHPRQNKGTWRSQWRGLQEPKGVLLNQRAGKPRLQHLSRRYLARLRARQSNLRQQSCTGPLRAPACSWPAARKCGICLHVVSPDAPHQPRGSQQPRGQTGPLSASQNKKLEGTSIWCVPESLPMPRYEAAV